MTCCRLGASKCWSIRAATSSGTRSTSTRPTRHLSTITASTDRKTLDHMPVDLTFQDRQHRAQIGLADRHRSRRRRTTSRQKLSFRSSRPRPTGDIVKDGDKTRVVTVALLGIHVVGTIEGHPEFVWSTFEHVNRTGRRTGSAMSRPTPSANAELSARRCLSSRSARWPTPSIRPNPDDIRVAAPVARRQQRQAASSTSGSTPRRRPSRRRSSNLSTVPGLEVRRFPCRR